MDASVKRKIPAGILLLIFAAVLVYLWRESPVRKVYETASTMGVVPVSFYARVVDQYGEPVSGAYFRASVMGSMLGNYTPVSGNASQSGGFRIEAKGSDITIMALQKPGYIFTATDCYGKHTCAFSAQDTFYAAKTAPHQKTWEDHQSGETAYTFKMHKLGYVEGVYSGMVYFVPPKDGGWQTMRMGLNEDASNSPDYVGHLRMRVLDRADDNWKVEIQAVNGGIQLAPKDDAYMSIAPESGYQQTFVFECKRDGDCNARNNRRFYFYSNGGKEYGAMVVGITHGMSGLYRINTKGSRDLNMSDIKQFDLNGNYR